MTEVWTSLLNTMNSFLLGSPRITALPSRSLRRCGSITNVAFTRRVVSILLPVMHSRSWLLGLLFALLTLRTDAQLHTALSVRSLPPDEAKQGLPVELRGTVIFIEGPRGTVFIQDGTAGSFFRAIDEITLRLGDEVEIKGRTAIGLYLPGVEKASYRLLRHGDVPPGTPASYADLLSGRYHYQRVAVEGIVQSAGPTGEEGRSRLQLAVGQDLLDVRVHAPPEDGRSLIDSRVRVEGLAAGTINNRRQLVQPSVWLQDWSGVTVLEEPVPDAHVPIIPGTNLLAFKVTGQGGHRVRVAGTVVASFADGSVYLRDGTAAFGLQLSIPAVLNPGDDVEAVGFPQMQRFSAKLSRAAILRQSTGTEPTATPVSAADLLKGNYDNDLVSIAGTVSNLFRAEDGHVLVLQGDGRRSIRVHVPAMEFSVPLGSEVRVTGVCLVEGSKDAGFKSLPSTVSLRSRGIEDVEILRSPSWWTARRMGMAVAALLLVVLLAGLWIAVLRRQVRRQTTALRRRIEHEAALEERQRIAREFHDTLEQGLAGLCLRLEAIQARGIDEKSSTLLKASRGLVSQIQAETRSLVSDLREPSEETVDLSSALAAIVDRHPAGCGPQLQMEVKSPLPPLPPRSVHHLRMIAQEAVTNALKHANSQRIALGLEIRGNDLVLTIADDGAGFDATTARVNKAGHFGCIGIEERCEKLGAKPTWLTAPGKGTTLEITLPISQVEVERQPKERRL